MKSEFKRLRGMVDLVPSAMAPWHRIEAEVRRVMHAYGYGEMRTPILEQTSLFERGIGEATDIVEKEMYSLTSRKGESLTMRPENTAGCVRAAIENGLLQAGAVSRIWYCGPMFRYERPQLGRQRQFHQTGAEVYGLAGPEIEAELILLSARIWRALGVESAVSLEINTLGTLEDRARFRERLVAYFSAHAAVLDEDSTRRLTRNPLRILDSKNPDMQALIAEAPSLQDSLCDDSRAHFDKVRELLSANGIDSTVNPRLVRGLDYYSHTVFEWVTDRLGAQSAVCAGGRYDGLLDQLGAAGTPGVGWAFGMERLVGLLDALSVEIPGTVPDVFVMSTEEVPQAEALALAESVRDALPGVSVLQQTQRGSMKSQFKKADRSGARIALVLGGDEWQAGEITIKPLRGDGEQRRVVRADLIGELSTIVDAATEQP